MGIVTKLFMLDNLFSRDKDDLYSWLFQYIGGKRNFSGAGTALLNLMIASPPTDTSLLSKSIPILLKVAKRYGIADKPYKLCSIIFTHFEKYFRADSPDSWKTWGMFLENILKKIKNRSEKERQLFVEEFHKFQQRYHPDISEVLRERYQIELTGMMLEHTTIEA